METTPVMPVRQKIFHRGFRKRTKRFYYKLLGWIIGIIILVLVAMIFSLPMWGISLLFGEAKSEKEASKSVSSVMALAVEKENLYYEKTGEYLNLLDLELKYPELSRLSESNEVIADTIRLSGDQAVLVYYKDIKGSGRQPAIGVSLKDGKLVDTRCEQFSGDCEL